MMILVNKTRISTSWEDMRGAALWTFEFERVMSVCQMAWYFYNFYNSFFIREGASPLKSLVFCLFVFLFCFCCCRCCFFGGIILVCLFNGKKLANIRYLLILASKIYVNIWFWLKIFCQLISIISVNEISRNNNNKMSSYRPALYIQCLLITQERKKNKRCFY